MIPVGAIRPNRSLGFGVLDVLASGIVERGEGNVWRTRGDGFEALLHAG
jgi:hypothetical protein